MKFLPFGMACCFSIHLSHEQARTGSATRRRPTCHQDHWRPIASNPSRLLEAMSQSKQPCSAGLPIDQHPLPQPTYAAIQSASDTPLKSRNPARVMFHTTTSSTLSQNTMTSIADVVREPLGDAAAASQNMMKFIAGLICDDGKEGVDEGVDCRIDLSETNDAVGIRSAGEVPNDCIAGSCAATVTFAAAAVPPPLPQIGQQVQSMLALLEGIQCLREEAHPTNADDGTQIGHRRVPLLTGLWDGRRVAVKLCCGPGWEDHSPVLQHLLAMMKKGTSYITHTVNTDSGKDVFNSNTKGSNAGATGQIRTDLGYVSLLQPLLLRTTCVRLQDLSDLEPLPQRRCNFVCRRVARGHRLHRILTFLEANSIMLERCQDCRAVQSGPGRPSSSIASEDEDDTTLTDLPGVLVPAAEALGALSPRRRALMALGAQPGMRIGLLLTPFSEMGNLRDLISDPQRSPFRVRPGWGPAQACKAFLATACEVAEAMGCLHSMGLVHGALKPSNVLLFPAPDDSRGFVARVTDVGAASRAAAVSWADWDLSTMATDPWVAAFLAPETVSRPWASVAAQMFPTSRSSDVFALGALMLTMMIGHPPSHSGSCHMATPPPAPTVAGDGDLAFRVSECACAAVRGIGDDIGCGDRGSDGEGGKAPPHLPPHGSLQLLISRCMATEPTDRTSIDQVVSELQRLQQELEAEGAER